MKLSILSFLSAGATGLLATGSDAATSSSSSSLRTRGLVDYNGISTNDGFDEKLGKCNGALCGIWGDPHIITCDGLTYDCQGTGLFTMMKNHVWNIQGHFLPVGAAEMKLVIDLWHQYPVATQTNDIIIDYVPSSQGIDRKLKYNGQKKNNNGQKKNNGQIKNYVGNGGNGGNGGKSNSNGGMNDSNDSIDEDKIFGGVAPSNGNGDGGDIAACPACCSGLEQEEHSVEWFTTQDDPLSTVTAIGSEVLMEFADDVNCGGVASLIQNMTATATVTLAEATTFDLLWSAVAEDQYETLTITVNGEIKTQFTSKADGDCVHTTCTMCVTEETTQQIQLNAGPNTITVNTTTQDEWYHKGAYFRVRFREASCDADCSGCKLTGGGLIEAGVSSDDTDIDLEPPLVGGMDSDSSLVPTMQFSFPDLSAHDGLIPSEEGCLVGFHYKPMNMQGHGLSNEPTIQACRERCDSIEGCVKFSYHGDGNCHPQDENSLLVVTPSYWSRSVAGPVHKCGIELPRTKTTSEFPFASTLLESRTEGNNCPFNFYLGGELQDISNLEAGGYLYGDANSDHSAKLDGDTRIRVSHKTESGAISEAMLQVTGDGPGELFACHWDFWVCLPEEEQDRFEEYSVGLFGSPDGNRQNDWMDVTAQPLAIPSDHKGRGAFDYCHENWCVSEEDSLMTYPDGTTYGDHKCVDEEYIPFDVNNEVCVISAQKIITKCAEKPPSLVHACQVECCYGGCNTFDEVEEEIVELVTLDTEEESEDIVFDPPVVEEDPFCLSTGEKVSTSDTVCPASPNGIVQIVHKDSDKMPEGGDQDIIYGIVLEEAKDDNIGQSVKFRVDNIFATEADVFVRYEKKVGEFANDPACESMPNTQSGCDVDATEIEVGCVEFPNVEPFALVDIFFVSNAANSFIQMNAAADTAVEKCCKPPDAYNFDENGYGVLKYTLKIQCSCPSNGDGVDSPSI